MLVDEIRAAVMAAPRVKLPEVAAVLWRAYGAGHVSEAEAEELSTLIETRMVVPAEDRCQPRSPSPLGGLRAAPTGLGGALHPWRDRGARRRRRRGLPARGLSARRRPYRGGRGCVRDPGAQCPARGAGAWPHHDRGAPGHGLAQRYERGPHHLGRLERVAEARQGAAECCAPPQAGAARPHSPYPLGTGGWVQICEPHAYY